LEQISGQLAPPGNPFHAQVAYIPGLDKYHGQDMYLNEVLTIEANKAMDEAVADGRPFYLYMSHYSSIRQGDWKLIFHYGPREAELFNLRDDLGERRNLTEQEPERANELIQELAVFLRESNAQMPIDKTTGRPVPLPGRVAELRN
jgi:arylsulfatase A-like enzyme